MIWYEDFAMAFTVILFLTFGCYLVYEKTRGFRR